MSDATGRMSIGWQQIGNDFYYFNNSGHAVTGWLQNGSQYYYLNPAADGRMVAGTSLTIDGVVYNFGTDGVCTSTVNASSVTQTDAKQASSGQSTTTDGDKKNVIVAGSN
jgi:glucan-binding YG repeat protein